MSYNPNVPPNSPTPPRGNRGGNRALYFIVGGLVVLAAVFVFIFTNGGPDAGTDAPAPAATEPATPEPATPVPATPEAAPAPAPEGDTGGTTNQ